MVPIVDTSKCCIQTLPLSSDCDSVKEQLKAGMSDSNNFDNFVLHYCQRMGYSKKNFKQRIFLSYIFDKTPEIFRFVILPLGILGITKLHLWKFHKIVLRTFEIPRCKIKTHENSNWFFLDCHWKVYFFFNWPLEFPHAISTIPLDILCPQLVCLHFYGIAKCQVHIPRIQIIKAENFI